MRYLILAAVCLIMGHKMGYEQGEKSGKTAALSMNPVSPELELACTVLWVGEQNKKYQERKR